MHVYNVNEQNATIYHYINCPISLIPYQSVLESFFADKVLWKYDGIMQMYIYTNTSYEYLIATHYKYRGIFCVYVVSYKVEIAGISIWKMDVDKLSIRICTVSDYVIHTLKRKVLMLMDVFL